MCFPFISPKVNSKFSNTKERERERVWGNRCWHWTYRIRQPVSQAAGRQNMMQPQLMCPSTGYLREHRHTDRVEGTLLYITCRQQACSLLCPEEWRDCNRSIDLREPWHIHTLSGGENWNVSSLFKECFNYLTLIITFRLCISAQSNFLWIVNGSDLLIKNFVLRRKMIWSQYASNGRAGDWQGRLQSAALCTFFRHAHG